MHGIRTRQITIKDRGICTDQTNLYGILWENAAIVDSLK